jgi:predicted nucleic-acid-binding Zn-ribbon protein
MTDEITTRDTSDFWRGFRDGKNDYAPRGARMAYLRGHRFGKLLDVMRRRVPTWHCQNCGRPHYGETKECRKCGYYRRKEQYP